VQAAERARKDSGREGKGHPKTLTEFKKVDGVQRRKSRGATGGGGEGSKCVEKGQKDGGGKWRGTFRKKTATTEKKKQAPL